MNTLILSGMGSSTPNWLPLLSPLVAIVLVVYAYQVTVRFIKRRKAERLQRLADTNVGHMDIHEPENGDGII